MCTLRSRGRSTERRARVPWPRPPWARRRRADSAHYTQAAELELLLSLACGRRRLLLLQLVMPPPSFLHHNLIAYNIPTVGGTPRDFGTYAVP